MIPLKVLHLSNARSWRGGERQAVTLARGLATLGHESVLACRPGTPLAQRAEQAGIPLLPLPMHSELDPLAVGRVISAVAHHGFNMLHLHTPHAHTVGQIASLLLENVQQRPRIVVSRRVVFPMRRHPLQSFKYGRSVDAFIATSYAVRSRLTGPTNRSWGKKLSGRLVNRSIALFSRGDCIRLTLSCHNRRGRFVPT